MKWNHFFSHNTRRREGSADSLLRLLAPSLLGMAVCMLTLCSLTWAWFNMSIATNIGTIQSASVEVCVSNDKSFTSDFKFISGSDTLTVPFSTNSTSQIATFADDKTSTGTQNALYFIVRSNVSANCSVYLKVDDTYYGPLEPVKPDTDGNYPTNDYQVYSIDLSETATTVSIHWGNLPTATSSPSLAEKVVDSYNSSVTVSWPNAPGKNVTMQSPLMMMPSSFEDDEDSADIPVISTDKDDEDESLSETPANDDAKTPDDTTTDDTVKDPSGVTGDTPTGTGAGDSGTAGTGESSGTGSDATDGDSGTGGSETGGDADNATNSVSGDTIPAGGSV